MIRREVIMRMNIVDAHNQNPGGRGGPKGLQDPSKNVFG
jgi:hypothetical protein